MTVDFFFILASASPRRREFMEVLGVPFTVLVPAMVGEAVDETPLPGETPAGLVERLSHSKAAAVGQHLPTLKPPVLTPPAGYTGSQGIVIAADTTVVLGQDILGKPEDPAEARQMLKRLRHENHWVYTSFTLAIPPHLIRNLSLELEQDAYGNAFVTRLHQSQVTMRPYADVEIEAYLATGDPFDKAGAYGIQHTTFAPVAQLAGCYAGVMGLPLGSLADTLSQLGLALPPVGPRCHAFTGHVCCQQ